MGVLRQARLKASQRLRNVGFECIRDDAKYYNKTKVRLINAALTLPMDLLRPLVLEGRRRLPP